RATGAPSSARSTSSRPRPGAGGRAGVAPRPLAEILEGGEQPVDVVLERDVAPDVAVGEGATRLGDVEDLELRVVHGHWLRPGTEQRPCRRRAGAGPPGRRAPSPRAWRSGHAANGGLTSMMRRTSRRRLATTRGAGAQSRECRPPAPSAGWPWPHV